MNSESMWSSWSFSDISHSGLFWMEEADFVIFCWFSFLFFYFFPLKPAFRLLWGFLLAIVTAYAASGAWYCIPNCASRTVYAAACWSGSWTELGLEYETSLLFWLPTFSLYNFTKQLYCMCCHHVNRSGWLILW